MMMAPLLILNDVILDSYDRFVIIVPEAPLAKGSIQLRSLGTGRFSDWSVSDKYTAHLVIRSVINQWQKEGITDYLIYGKESTAEDNAFTWEIVPYPKTGWAFWNQFKVLWNITFGCHPLPLVERQHIALAYAEKKSSYSSIQLSEKVNQVALRNDAFCNSEIIDKQRVFEGRNINVLYNYAPLSIGNEKLHFLIVPKEHRERFIDLTEEEYSETMELSQKLITHYREQGFNTVYMFDKTGKSAGQTVPHWHGHQIFTATKTQEFYGKLLVLKNMLFGSSSLSKNELATKVAYLKAELEEVLSKEPN